MAWRERGDERDRADPHRLRRLAALAVALAGAALIATGCGGDDEGAGTEASGEEATTEPADEALGQEDYVAEVREAIGPVATESEELISRATEAQRVEDLAPPLGDAEEVYRDAADGLEALAPPPDVGDLHDELVVAQEDIADAAGSAQRAARQGDREGLDEFRQAGDRYRDRAEQLSREFSERGFEF